MSDPLNLSLGQQFELERMTRAIDATAEVEVLQRVAKELQWVMRQQLGGPARLSGDLAAQWGLDAA
jgi:hypothetical protein